MFQKLLRSRSASTRILIGAVILLAFMALVLYLYVYFGKTSEFFTEHLYEDDTIEKLTTDYVKFGDEVYTMYGDFLAGKIYITNRDLEKIEKTLASLTERRMMMLKDKSINKTKEDETRINAGALYAGEKVMLVAPKIEANVKKGDTKRTPILPVKITSGKDENEAFFNDRRI